MNFEVPCSMFAFVSHSGFRLLALGSWLLLRREYISRTGHQVRRSKFLVRCSMFSFKTLINSLHSVLVLKVGVERLGFIVGARA